MSPLLALLIVAVGIVALLGIAAVASDRRADLGRLTLAEIEPRSMTRRPQSTGSGAGTSVLEPPPERDREPSPVTSDEYNVTRRRFFNRATYAVFGLLTVQFALASLAFMWPKLKAGFGTKYNAGSFSALKAEVLQGSTVVPKAIPAAQAWIVPMPLDRIPGSSYENLPTIVTGGEDDGIGLMALWHRCPHLGCRVPECIPSQGFECPCHGSKFNIHGEYAAGPSPRNMDRFIVTTNAAGEMIIDTGTIIQTARSKTYTAQYPVGPFCV
jgi:cytochrome b6-f complex iron-sulfur subunit